MTTPPAAATGDSPALPSCCAVCGHTHHLVDTFGGVCSRDCWLTRQGILTERTRVAEILRAEFARLDAAFLAGSEIAGQQALTVVELLRQVEPDLAESSPVQ